MSKLLRGGRLNSVREDISKFTSSIKDDLVLSQAVVDINKAHVIMLLEENIIDKSTGIALLKALVSIGSSSLDESSEDIHMAIEEYVLKKTNEEVGGNLHIAKSRNDQIATAIRIHLRNKLLESMEKILILQKMLLEVAEKHVNTIFLQYTHLQPAQPVTYAHYLLSIINILERNFQRLKEGYSRVNLCPLGAGALATTSFEINRTRVSELLGFNEVLENSIDAVGHRDFILESLSVLTILSTSLSRFAEDLIIWSSPAFNVVELPDEFASTSSIMPQKKNPEPLEIIRANSSRILGDFVASASNLKALPSTYNLDFQQITPNLWNSIRIVNDSLFVLSELVPKLKIKPYTPNKAKNSFVAATEVANFLTKEFKIPFRTSHKIVGTLVSSLIDKKLTFDDLTPKLVQNACKNVANRQIEISTEQISNCTNLYNLVNSHKIKGGPAKNEVKRAIIKQKEQITKNQKFVIKINHELASAKNHLESKISTYINSNLSTNVKFKNLNL